MSLRIKFRVYVNRIKGKIFCALGLHKASRDDWCLLCGHGGPDFSTTKTYGKPWLADAIEKTKKLKSPDPVKITKEEILKLGETDPALNVCLSVGTRDKLTWEETMMFAVVVLVTKNQKCTDDMIKYMGLIGDPAAFKKV